MQIGAAHFSPDRPGPYAIAQNETRLCLAMGIGSFTGFDLNTALGQDLCKWFVQQVIEQSSANIQSIQQIFAETPETLKYIADNFHDAQSYPDPEWQHPACTFIGGFIENRQAYWGWQGNEEAYLVRGSELIRKTQGHSWFYDFSPDMQAQVDEAPALKHFSQIPKHAIKSNPGHTQQPEFLDSPWQLQPNDNVIVLSGKLAFHLSLEQIIAATQENLVENVAQHLIQSGADSDSPYSHAAIVVKIA
jgi:serine/threonine protein phosphatase PrpC